MEKRQRVMQRSIRLGHCICNPRISCPCEVLREQDVCPCAGETMPAPVEPVRLTQLVSKTGCSSKIDQATLRRVLSNLPVVNDPRVLIGAPAGDDAGVYQLDNGQALVQTVDVFSPCVDDPCQFGQIAAANSVSDIYAMGGRPLTALSIIGFPAGEVPDAVMQDILRGGLDKMAEAGVAVIGGHSIDDPEIKAGFAVTGLIDPHKIVSNAGARPGDALVLTKPIGTGIITFAGQIGRAPPGSLAAVAQSMAELNKTAAELMVAFNAHACTDITGFGLMGHLSAMAAASGVDVEIIWDDIPVFPGVMDCIAAGIIPGSVERNRESSGQALVADDNLGPASLEICFDAQTSGGLLIAIAEADAPRLVSRLIEAGVTAATIIGRMTQRGGGRVYVRNAEPTRPGASVLGALSCNSKETHTMSECCPSGHNPDCADPKSAAATSGEAGVSETQRKFQEFLRSANQPGALDAYTKQAIAIALAVLAKCAPCVKRHVAKAREKGFSQEEIDEAAWLAISFGGAPLMMFYNEIRKETA